ncbi:MAG: gamma-glutamyl-gamma-aminobutyrate hydrolase family protein, partial [Chloroflexi bacterium]|nr:gamma-glutamyl-gamma-aminobutyrate hydrolase family protein [Chloroflexota bacterium]
MPDTQPTTPSHRVATTGDIEVATYLEIASADKVRGRPGAPAGREPLEAVVVLDFGSQYSHLIARRVREAHAYCEIVPHNAPHEAVDHLNLKGIILSGGPNSVYEPGAPLAPGWVFEAGVPVLGICYGMQLIAHQLGGRVAAGLAREYGFAVIHKESLEAPLLEGLDESTPVWMSHGDRIEKLPPGFKSLAY